MSGWLKDMVTSSALMGALLWIIHPELYAAGIQALTTLASHPELVKEGDELAAILQVWSSPYSSYSIISNRESIGHQDNNSRPAWYDMLVSVGTYNEGVLTLPGLGLTFQYNPGTVVGLCGKLLKHAVPEVVGNRVCLAYYMRDKVHERIEVSAPGWMTLDKYEG